MSTSSKQPGPQLANTSCKACVFAEYDDITQVGCEAHQLEKFRETAEVIEAYDEEKEFFVIKGMTCQFHRPQNWKYAKATNRLEQARDEIKLDYDVTIIVDEAHKSVLPTIETLMKQSKRPNRINIVVVDPTIEFDRETVLGCSVPWTVETRIENEHAADRNYLRNIIRKQKSPLVCYVKAGTTLKNPDLFSMLEKMVIDEQFQFGMIKISDSEFIVPKVCYDYFNFMIDSKIKSICEMENEEGIIDLCSLK